MKKTVITIIRIIVIVAILGLLTYGGFVGMNRVSGTGDYTIDQYAATDDGGLLTVTKGGTALTKEELLVRGMNQSRLHEDVMIGAEDSHITGKCRDGRTVELFRDGVWVL